MKGFDLSLVLVLWFNSLLDHILFDYGWLYLYWSSEEVVNPVSGKEVFMVGWSSRARNIPS